MNSGDYETPDDYDHDAIQHRAVGLDYQRRPATDNLLATDLFHQDGHGNRGAAAAAPAIRR